MNTICTNCGSYNKTKSQARHTLLGEVAIWLVAIIIGPVTAWISIAIAIVYSLWRAVAKKSVCSGCGHDALIDASTPRGQKIRAEYE